MEKVPFTVDVPPVQEKMAHSPNEKSISRWIERWFVGVKDEAIKDRGLEQIRTTANFQSQLVSSLKEVGRRCETEIERDWWCWNEWLSNAMLVNVSRLSSGVMLATPQRKATVLSS